MALSGEDLAAIKQLIMASENRTQIHTQQMIMASENRTQQMIMASENRMQRELKEIKTDTGKMRGILTETNIRQALNRKSVDETDGVLVQSLPDLTRLVVSCIKGPTNYGPRPFKVALREKLHPSQEQVTHRFVKKLVDYIYSKNATIQEKLINEFSIRPIFAKAIFTAKGTSEIQLPLPTTDFEGKIRQFVVMDKSQRSYSLETCDGFGFLLFSCACDTVPVHELELDVKPFIEKFTDVLILKVSEIKSSRSLVSDAASQLKQRLDVLERAAIVMYGNGIKVRKVGTVLIPLSEREESSEYNPDSSKLGFELLVKYI